MDFGLERTSAPHSVAPYRDTEHSIEAVAQKMREARHDVEVRRWATDTLAAAGFDGRARTATIREAATALLGAVRSSTTYIPDPAGTEWVQSAKNTLCLGDAVCLPGVDCDDSVVALGGAILSIGFSAYAVVQDFGSGPEHVLVGFIDESGKKFYADASNTLAGVYDQSKAVSEEWIDPLEQVGRSGTAGPELVMLGNDRARDVRRVDGVWTERRYGTVFMHRRGRWQSARAIGLGEIPIVHWHSIHELSDLLNALQFQVDRLSAAYEAAKGPWSAADNAGFLAWEQGYQTALASWNQTATRARAAVTASVATSGPLDWDWQPTIEPTGEDLFDSVAKAFQPFEDLDREMRQARGVPPQDLPTYTGTPQPTAPDFELDAYKMADKGAKALDELGRQLRVTVDVVMPWVGLGLAALAVGAVVYYAPRRSQRA